ncbi:MAG TPA: hypothetical protein VFM79_11940, partial [Pelobium sp.]|nr:hypothetical protein [Pelobium sp.]
MKKQFIENKKLYLFGTLAMMGIMSFIFFWKASLGNGLTQTDQAIFLGTGMISFGCLFSLTLFSSLDNAKGRSQVFMFPATFSEKMLCAIIYGTLLFPIVYIATVYPLLILANYFDNNYMGHFNEAYIFNLKHLQIKLLSVFYVLQTMVLLCSVFFRQYKIVKSIVLICLLFFGTMLFYPKVINRFLPLNFKKEISVEIRHFDKLQLQSKKTTKINKMLIGRSASPFQEVRYFSGERYFSLDVPFH